MNCRSIYIAIILLLFSFSVHAKSLQQRFVLNGFAQGTSYQLVYYHAFECIRQTSIDSILHEIDLSMSIYKPNSLISVFNRAETSSILMDRHFKHVMEYAFQMHEQTQGRFDLTVAPLVQAWGFGPKRIKELPDEKAIADIMPYIGMKYLKLANDSLYKLKAGVQIDVNGIAQGYSVDVIADYLSEQGLANFMIELGGEMRSKGTKPGREKFLVGIERPYLDHGVYNLKKDYVFLENAALTTAGNFDKYYINNGEKVTHHINPFTGHTFVTSIISASVYAESAMEADALDNYFMSLTPEEAIKFANKRKKIEVYIVYKDEKGAFREIHSKVFSRLLKNN